MFVNNDENPFVSAQNHDTNFFLQPEDISNHQPESQRRLNDYDYNILKDGAYKEVNDEILKLEYKISKIEEEIATLNSQIQAAKDIRDFGTAEKIFCRIKLLQDELKELKEIYKETSLSAKISGGVTGMFSGFMKKMGINKTLSLLYDTLVSKMPKRFSAVLELKQSLEKLENINKSVDELMTMQTPYGESIDKYEQLSKFIVKANNIQAQISKSLR